MLTVVLVVLLVLLLFGAVGGAPVYGQPAGWHGYGWGPSGLLGVLLVVLLFLLILHAL